MINSTTVLDLLSDVMVNVGEVAKSGENKGLGYTYASEADLLNVVQPLLAERGVMLRKKSSEIVINEFDQRGKHKFLIRVVWTFESNFGFFETESFGYAECKQGFAPAKAQTQSLKYVMRQTFCIPTGDDPDATAAPEEENVKKLILNVGFNDKKQIRELGAKTEWDRSGPGKDTFLHWWVEDTAENREKCSAYIPQEIDMLKKLKVWADKHYDGFDEMVEFCIQKTNRKSSPESWDSNTIASFMEQMDSGNGTLTGYKNWRKGRKTKNKEALSPDKADDTSQVPF